MGNSPDAYILICLATCYLYVFMHLSLYSTATQNTWRRGLALGNAPDARILHWRYQHVGIFWRYLMLKFAFSPTPTPDASQWNIGCVGSQFKMLGLAMYISCFLCRFHLRLVPNVNPISSGIWALSPYSTKKRVGARDPTQPIFHWKWGWRWLPNANEIYTKK